MAAIWGLHNRLVWCEALHSEQFQLCNAIPILSPFFLYHPYIPHSLIQRIFLFSSIKSNTHVIQSRHYACTVIPVPHTDTTIPPPLVSTIQFSYINRLSVPLRTTGCWYGWILVTCWGFRSQWGVRIISTRVGSHSRVNDNWLGWWIYSHVSDPTPDMVIVLVDDSTIFQCNAKSLLTVDLGDSPW